MNSVKSYAFSTRLGQFCLSWGWVIPRVIIFIMRLFGVSRDSSVGIPTGYRLDRRGSIPEKAKFFLFHVASRPAPGATQPPIQWVQGALSPAVKRPGREAEVKNYGAVILLFRISSWRRVQLSTTIVWIW
jgi:hypothetical protein